MRQTFFFSLVAALLLVTAHRLPAPIQEVPGSPTPAPAQSAKPKPKLSASPSKVAKNAKLFAGRWQGTIRQDVYGLSKQSYEDSYLIEIDTNETVISLSIAGSWEGPYVISKRGNSISWSHEVNVAIDGGDSVSLQCKATLTVLKDRKRASIYKVCEKVSGFIPSKSVQSGILRKRG